jgi:hypothetical protein
MSFKESRGREVWVERVASRVERGVRDGWGIGMLNLIRGSSLALTKGE